MPIVHRHVTLWERDTARKLLGELDGMVGSKTPTVREFQDWNMRAQTFLVFAACRRIGNGDLQSAGFPAQKSVD